MTVWKTVDGTPVSCRDKLRTLDENLTEARQVLQDAFDDAVLMGVGADAMRQVLAQVVVGLSSPHR